jgi:hypothetical protein
MRDHGDGAIPAGRDFFVPPPAEIGEVVSAYSSLREGVRPTRPRVRAALVAVCGGAGFGVGILLTFLADNLVPCIVLGIPLGSLGVVLPVYLTRFRHRCTYVGREGVARFCCSGRREQLVVQEVFRFRDAAELRVSQVNRFANGAYQGTDYKYTWTDVLGQPCYRIAGTHRSRDDTPPSNDPFQYALATEMAWSNYLLEQVRARLLMSGAVTFGLGGSDSVRLGEGKMILCLDGQTTECTADDIGEVRLRQGRFEVRRKDAQQGWFSSTGVFKFSYARLGNAQLFLFLLDQLVGVRFSE